MKPASLYAELLSLPDHELEKRVRPLVENYFTSSHPEVTLTLTAVEKSLVNVDVKWTDTSLQYRRGRLRARLAILIYRIAHEYGYVCKNLGGVLVCRKSS